MRTIAFLLLVAIPILYATLSSTPNESFSRAKNELREIYQNKQTTFYCGCDYNYKNKRDMIDNKSCGYVPRNPYTKKGKVNITTKQVGWEHVVPVENFGRQFSCWRNGDIECVKKDGKPYKGRKCCTKINKTFRIMQADMHNLFPTIGELNIDRKNYRYDFASAQPEQYGLCDFQVLFKEKRARIKKDIRGNVARAYLYMSDQYGMKLSKQEQRKFQAWHSEDTVDAWEIKRNERIEKVQGNSNPLITKP